MAPFMNHIKGERSYGPIRAPLTTKLLDHLVRLVNQAGRLLRLCSSPPQTLGAKAVITKAPVSNDNEMKQEAWSIYALILDKLNQRGIQAQEVSGSSLPPEAVIHDRGAPIPALVISPRSE